MTWRRDLVRTAGRLARRRVFSGVLSDRETVRAHHLVDPDWRRVENGFAARLDARTTIDVAEPVGRWAGVDPRLPDERWRSPGKAMGLALWASAVGVAWWVGASRGRGPLAMLDEPDGTPAEWT